MSDQKKFANLPIMNKISTVAVGAVLAVFFLAVVVIGAGFLWKLVLWAWS